MTSKKKLIEVALPLEAINNEALHRKQKAPKGWPTSFHKWWAQRPLAVARAVIFAQMVDDPSSMPNAFPTEESQRAERRRLFRIIEELVKWDNTANQEMLKEARDRILDSWRNTCAENTEHSNANGLFDRDKLPTFYDPFAGSGSLPLSAQWLGLESYANDLNPVAVLINKAMIEIPAKFAGKPPVNQDAVKQGKLSEGAWSNAQGLAEDVRYYSHWMRDEAERRIGHLYPKIKLPKESGDEEGTIIAWLWTRTVKCPNPICGGQMPMLTTFLLSKKGKQMYIVPKVSGRSVTFGVSHNPPEKIRNARTGMKRGTSGVFECIYCGTVTTRNYVSDEGKAKRIGVLPTAVVAEGADGRIYLPPDDTTTPTQLPPIDDRGLTIELSPNPRDVWCKNFGLNTPADLFTPRQLVALTTFSDLIVEARELVKRDAVAAGMPDNMNGLDTGGTGATAYAEAISVFLACVVDRMAYYGSSLTTWLPKDNALRDCMPRQALPMVWDYAECNPFGKSSGDVITCSRAIVSYLEVATPFANGRAVQYDAQRTQDSIRGVVISTDPPYYANIGYADLSDFFYVWLRRSLKSVFPDLFSTLTVPKKEELVALPYRHECKEKAEAFFLDGMTRAMRCLAAQAHPAFPVTIYYAYKQSESDGGDGTINTGWDTFLAAVMAAGFTVTGTWPLRTEGEGRMVASGTNALASSIILVCRRRDSNAPLATRREFVTTLKHELPYAIKKLQEGNIAPVDLPQASIGPGIAVFSRYSKVLESDGSPMTVRTALQMINAELDTFLRQEEGDMDAETQFAVSWFEQFGMNDGPFGVAETLSKAKNTSVDGMSRIGILKSKGGKVSILPRSEYSDNWNPVEDTRVTLWECTQHLILRHQGRGEEAAADLVAGLGVGKSEDAKTLAYRLFSICESKGWAEEARPYNELVSAWSEIQRKAAGLTGEGPQKRLDFTVENGRGKK